MNIKHDYGTRILSNMGIRLVREERKPIDKVLTGDLIIQELCYNSGLNEQETKLYCDFYVDNQVEINRRINQWYNPN
jgi:hypothetical protein